MSIEVIQYLSGLANTLTTKIMLELSASYGAFFVRQSLTSTFKSFFPLEGPDTELSIYCPLIFHLLNNEEFIYKPDVYKLFKEAKTVGEFDYWKELVLDFEKQNSVLALGIYSDNYLISVLFLGSKEKGEFNSKDLSLISDILKTSSKELEQVLYFQDSQLSIIMKNREFNFCRR